MDLDRSLSSKMEDTKLIFKRASSDSIDKSIILNALQDCRAHLTTFPVDELENDVMFYMMPCMRNVFSEIYTDNQKIDSVEQIEELLENLTITISLTEFIEDLLNFISTRSETSNLQLFKSMVLEIPKCIYLTYKHCKESQKKYQNLMKDCKEILILYKKNQECHLKYLDIMGQLPISADDSNCTKILIETFQSISSIIEILLGLNIKALADSWKCYCNLIEKYQEVLVAEKFYCLREIELLEIQIQNFMDIALESNDSKQVLQYSKLSGFLLKVALKIIAKFWQYLCIDHIEPIYNLVCSIYKYAPEFLEKQMVTTDVKKSIDTCLLDVITSFVEDSLLHDDVLERILLNINTSKKECVGCLELILKILEFIGRQTPDSVDSSFFYTIMKSVFSNFSTYFPEPSSVNSIKIPGALIEKLSSQISQSVEVHNSFYNQDFELLMISNILGNHIGCHTLASFIWIQLISQTFSDSRLSLLGDLFQVINDSRVDVSFISSKVILLKKFMQKLFSILDESERQYFLKLYPPSEYLHLWKVIGLNFVPLNDNSLNALLEDISTSLGDIKRLNVEKFIESVEVMKILAGASVSVLDIKTRTLSDIVRTLWDTNFEVIPCDNLFFKYSISCLSEVTMSLMNYFSNDQLFSILKRMETLATTYFVRIRLCLMLSEISRRKTEHNMEQNKLNFLISDLFELLLKEDDEMLKELTLKVFQQFANNNQPIIVNNVSRMLPDMNLEQYLQNGIDKFSSNSVSKVLDSKIIDHKCLIATKNSLAARNSFEWNDKIPVSRENSFDSLNGGKALSRECSFETRNEFAKSISTPSVEFKRSTSYSKVQQQSKRPRLSETAEEEDDTINEVLQRIRGELKCLNKILRNEKPTAKNAQDIKLLAFQLQSLLES
ncbi:uncharacterized protein LOC123307239 [Coccinella septempunctata]|uniref:uncharacterized protein LOC123307239 n=1 Tax=Coccinella septempunctata TaxID=41139 RepID=UPI001D063090|nr:uncharacterized protein LOC123307239 [Coccinella septempunctata]